MGEVTVPAASATSFILPMLDDSRATALADAFRALSDYGCDLAQGFFMSKPLPAGELDAWLTSRDQQPQTGPLSDLYPGSTADVTHT